ncbi:MAG TPA: tetratricopeptide repeat protein [Stellaceae bacterium]|nr:tetratricopeptide repeat protein [Stellaceae bacterium]
MRLGSGTRRGDLPDPDHARIVAGHHLGRSLESLFPGRPIRRIVLLRDPLELQLSLYNWQMMDHLAKGLGTYSLALHLQAMPRDFMAHFLLSRWLELSWSRLLAMTDAAKHRALDRMLGKFWFVGAHTDCDRLIAALGPEFDVPPLARARNTAAQLQAETGWPLVTAATLSPAMRETIRANHRLDLALWQEWHGAGFDAARPRRHAAPPAGGSGFLAHEMIRPCFMLARWAGRCRSWRRRAQEPAGVKIARANRARNTGQWELAAKDYRAALQDLPNASAIWVQYGHVLKESGQIDAAERAYRRAISLNPDIADTHLHLGHALKLQGRIDEAVEAYLRSARLDRATGHARLELVGLGWTPERIEQIVSAAVSDGMRLPQRAS